MSHIKGIKGIKGRQVELQGGAPCWAGHTKWAPPKGVPWSLSPSRSLLEISQKVAFQKYPSSTFYYSSHHFFASEKSVKFSVCLEHFQHPTKWFWTCSETFPDHWFSSAKSNLSISGSSKKFPKKYFNLFSRKIPEVTRTILAPSKSTRCLPEPFRLSGSLRNNFSVLPKLFRCSLSGTFPFSPKPFRWLSLRLPV